MKTESEKKRENPLLNADPGFKPFFMILALHYASGIFRFHVLVVRGDSMDLMHISVIKRQNSSSSKSAIYCYRYISVSRCFLFSVLILLLSS